jgi:DNA-binding NarL/FixJ family response regulator
LAAASSGPRATKRKHARHLPAVAFVDLRLERGSDDYRPGWHLVQHLHHLGVDKPLKTIIYSGTPMTDEIVLEAVRLGCSYVVKEDLWEHELELIASALLAAQAGSVLLSNEVAGGIETIVNQLETGALLTDKEWEVLKLLATGLTNKQIGRRLFIAVTTVKSHVSSILDKLGVDNRVQAAEWYRRQNS